MPYQVIYSSASTTPMQSEDLDALLAQAQRKNAAAGITGALVYVDGCFLQVLEGPAGPVQTLMDRIRRDPRHETVTVLQAHEIGAAAFPDWTMAHVGATAAEVAAWAGLSARTELPDTLAEMGRDRQRAMQALDGILRVLVRTPPPADQQ
ncbi:MULTISPECIES: BLUF domain-containing protein [unclassified Roseateles]|uniref:BLUF domain-containing protein n=1 Tax=unclassified Roseateles TaxID=2626991 RepID=UPI00071515BA|nr:MULTISPECIES: BLUF domain-containing protein [unclassified Roseateles]KQW42013.1 hypothetical protein ASC81_22150 [Pelomonas sp. Root405]KRA67616.1 hypothetical protein ASD88_23735 [Pelomonas sp. Root662]